MKVDSLKDLKSAFARWRRHKKHLREPVPEQLVERARRAVTVHGWAAVLTATKLDRARLARGVTRSKSRGSGSGRDTSELQTAPQSPTFSRLEIDAPIEPEARPLAELVMSSEVRLRVYEATPEMLGLLSAACGLGGAR